jgi:hypothetical protein
LNQELSMADIKPSVGPKTTAPVGTPRATPDADLARLRASLKGGPGDLAPTASFIQSFNAAPTRAEILAHIKS